jgi:hypothetical protein
MARAIDIKAKAIHAHPTLSEVMMEASFKAIVEH